jgi:signal transduction histidine kinase
MRFVLDNVISNAVKYSPDNNPVDIRCEADGEGLTIRVTNAYPALTGEELEVIFAPFRRLGYDEGVEGNGLGLAFARKIVEDHGGTIRASSVEEGFCMTIRLPFD